MTRDIVETLYAHTLVLADEARAVFDLRLRAADESTQDAIRLALSIEGLRTTTRIMHVLAWLLNRRAYFAGELSEAQLRRQGALAQERRADPAMLERLEPETRALIHESEELHARVARLDREWRAQDALDAPVAAMQGRIAAAFARPPQATESARL